MDELKKELAVDLFERGVIQFGEFTLKSGLKSPIYIDLRLLISYPKVLKKVAKAMVDNSKKLHFEIIAGIPFAAISLATAMSLEQNIPMVFPRKDIKEHGTKKSVEGTFEKGQVALVVDDLITTGESKMEAIAPLLASGLKVKDVCVLIDREQGGKDALKKHKIKLHAVMTITELITLLHEDKKISTDQFEKTRDYIKSSKA